MTEILKYPSAVLAVFAISAVLAAEKQPIERYQSIIDRQMFGPLPKDFDPTKMPSEVSRSSSSAAEKELTQEQAQLQSAIHFSVINVDHDGKPVVGFTDNSDPKAPVHYYMHVGETQNGWLVKEANPDNATMTIAKGEVEVELTLGDNSAKGGGKTSAAGSATKPASGSRGGLLGGTLSARRAMRRQAEQAEAQKREAEQAEKEAARQAQAEQEKAERDAERAQQRQQLMAIQEELRKAREEKAKHAQEAEGGDGNNDSE